MSIQVSLLECVVGPQLRRRILYLRTEIESPRRRRGPDASRQRTRRKAVLALALAAAALACWPSAAPAEPVRPRVSVPALPSETIHDARVAGGELLLATPRGLYATPLLSAPAGSTPAPGTAELPDDVSADLSAEGRPLLADASLRLRGGVWRTVLGRVAARQLAVGPGGLWIATDGGLWEWDFERRPRRVVDVGSDIRGVVQGRDGSGWLASELGLFVRPPRLGRAAGASSDRPAGTVARWQRTSADPELAGGAVRALAAGVGPGGVQEVWAASEGALWRLGSGGRWRRALVGLSPGWWELRGLAQTPAGIWLAVPQGVWHIAEGGTVRIALRGAAVSAIRAAADRSLGSLAGLSSTEPVSRGAAAVSPDAVAVVRGGAVVCIRPGASPRSATFESGVGRVLGLVQGADRGLLALRPGGIEPLRCTTGDAPEVAPELGPRPGPEVAQPDVLPASEHTRAQVARLHRLVLGYLDLAPAGMRRLERRARGRGFWPELRLGMAMDARRGRESDRDQAFSGGAVRDLHDVLQERQRDAGVELQLVWKLGEAAEPDAFIAISRERREQIELREQVLERVDQIFFERLRVQARLAAGDALSADERLELELRVRELGASLDAWTGGEFSRLQPEGAP